MSKEGASVAMIARAVVRCPRCGAIPGESCADRMYVKAKDGGDETAARELDLLARSTPHLAHPERLKEAEHLLDSAVAYGLIERVRR
jgi:hypothetical protein